MRAPRRATLCVAAAVALALGMSQSERAVADDTTTRHVVFTITSDLVTESSSLVVSTVHPGLVYTTNDSGDQATIYVLDASNGDLVGRTSLAGVLAVDFEALAVGDNGALVVGDVGDNHAQRDSLVVYKLPQPGRGDVSVTPDAVTLTYPDGPRDAESILYDGRTGRVFVASKLLGGAKVYRSPPDVFDRRRAGLMIRAPAPAIATDATFIRDERFAVIRTYFGAVVYRYPSWRRVVSFDLPPQPQGESVAAAGGGKALWIGSEGRCSRVLRVSLPNLDPTSSSASTSPPTATRTTTSIETTVESPHREQLRSIAWVVLGIAAVALLMVMVAGLVLYRRRDDTSP